MQKGKFKTQKQTCINTFRFKYHLKTFRPTYIMTLSHLHTLSISSLHNLDIETNKFYERGHPLYDAVLLTRCYTQHALQPYIDSEINRIRHFIKIQFVNKGIEFINLPSIFKDESVIFSIPTYFDKKESRIICYKYMIIYFLGFSEVKMHFCHYM